MDVYETSCGVIQTFDSLIRKFWGVLGLAYLPRRIGMLPALRPSHLPEFSVRVLCLKPLKIPLHLHRGCATRHVTLLSWATRGIYGVI